MERKISNNVVSSFKRQLDIMKSRCTRAFEEYRDVVDSNLKFFLDFGYFSDNGRDNEMKAYLHYVSLYCRSKVLETRYYSVKGIEAYNDELQRESK